MLHVGDHLLADRFAGLLPAPGGRFVEGDWVATAFGPVPADTATWAGIEVDRYHDLGYGLLIEATIVELHVATDPVPPLVHVRGRYRELAG
jgi:3-hydroxy-9,10-secoandrosta-1,3,5(10)-triene-9,17-dione monooxygenase reductase component